MQKLIVLRGYPGSGKTTVGKVLEKKEIGRFIDHNKILNFITSITDDDEGVYDEIHSLEKAMAVKLLTEGKSVIIARGFATKNSITAYVDSINDKIKVFVFRLHAPAEVLEKRVQSTERKSDFNPTITPQALHKWTKENPMEIYPGEHIIDVTHEVNDVVLRIEKILSSNN